MASNLPDYVASAKPLPTTARVPWYKSTAQTYAGIMLWFVFWQQVPSGSSAAPGGFLAHGLGSFVKVASTHGGLNYRNTTAFIMSTAGALPPLMRSREVPANMTALTGQAWPLRK